MNKTKAPPDESRDSVAGTPKKISREELERMTSQLIRTLHKRSTAHRFKPSPETDSPRLQYARACIAAVTAYTALLRDSELDALDKRIAELEKQNERSKKP
jgi:hypothetical protein